MERSIGVAFLIISGALLASPVWAAADKPLALRGLDPVHLVMGDEAVGSSNFYSNYGRLRYQFTGPQSKAEFDHHPQLYAAQRNGHSLNNIRGLGDPDVFCVYKGKIYLASNQDSLDRLQKNMDRAVELFNQPKSVAILLFPGVQIIDFSGPWEVLGQAGFEVYTVSESDDMLNTSMGLHVTPDFTFENCPVPTVLLTPGGNVPPNAPADNKIVQFVKRMSGESEYTMSVCNGAFWLAGAGLLDGKEATTYYGLVELLRTNFPKVKVEPEKRFIDNGKVMTTSGLSSGIDGALKLVAKLNSEVEAMSVALNMEYNYQPNSTYSRAALADKYLHRVSDPWDVRDATKIKELETGGDRSKWTQAWELVNPDLTLKELNDNLSKAAQGRWIDSGHHGETRLWMFKGDDGAQWVARSLIQEDPKEKGRFIARFELERK